MHEYFFSFCCIFVAVFQVALGVNEECGLNEVYAECVDSCNTCHNPTGQTCIVNCVPGCTCKPEYSRNKKGLCIPKKLCNVPYEATENVTKSPDSGFWCTNSTCKRTCQRRGMTDGYCTKHIRPQCQCNGTKSSRGLEETSTGGEHNFKEQVTDPSAATEFSCLSSDCRQTCRRQGFKDGHCIRHIRSYCQCIIHATNPPLVKEGHPREGGHRNHGGCPNVQRCSHFCQTKGFPSGTCSSPGYHGCRCFKYADLTSPFNGQAESGTCPNLRRCVHNCRLHGLSGGTCDGHICRCYRSRSEDSKHEPSQFVPHLGGDLDPTRPTVVELPEFCNLRRCGGLCFSKGYSFARCLEKNFCKCYSKTQAIPDYDGDNESHHNSGNSCPNVNRCARSCVRSQFIGGVCVGTRRQICRCIREEQASSFTGNHGRYRRWIPDQEVYEPLNTNKDTFLPDFPMEEEFGRDDAEGCPHSMRCLRSCRRRGFMNGFCRGNRGRTCVCEGPKL